MIDLIANDRRHQWQWAGCDCHTANDSTNRPVTRQTIEPLSLVPAYFIIVPKRYTNARANSLWCSKVNSVIMARESRHQNDRHKAFSFLVLISGIAYLSCIVSGAWNAASIAWIVQDRIFVLLFGTIYVCLVSKCHSMQSFLCVLCAWLSIPGTVA